MHCRRAPGVRSTAERTAPVVRRAYPLAGQLSGELWTIL
jgi:hypothetical protein